MRDRDYLWCLVNLMLDEEELLSRLCPPCRQRAEDSPCPSCGSEMADWTGEVNLGFDDARFDALGRGEIL